MLFFFEILNLIQFVRLLITLTSPATDLNTVLAYKPHAKNQISGIFIFANTV